MTHSAAKSQSQKYQERPHSPGKEVVNGESAPYLGTQPIYSKALIVVAVEQDGKGIGRPYSYGTNPGFRSRDASSL